MEEIPGVGRVGCETRFADYRDIDGVQIPFNITAKYSTPRVGTWTYRVDKIETALKLGEDPFPIQ